MKVLFIASQFPAYDETFLMREMAAVRNAGLDIEILSLRRCRDEIVHDEAKSLIDVSYHIPYLSAGVIMDNLRMALTRPFRYFGALLTIMATFAAHPVLLLKNLAMFPKAVRLAAHARELEFGHIHALWATYAATVAWVAHRLTGITYSITGHAHDIYLNQTMLPRKLGDAAMTMTCTADNKKFLSRYCDANKIIVQYHGLAVDRFFPVAQEPRDEFRLLGVGSMFENKGWEHLIDAVDILRRKGVPATCTLVGGGRLLDSLRARVNKAGLGEYVRFTDFVKQGDMPAFYQNADLFVLPAVRDIHWGIPNVLIEAMACALPFLITRLPSVAEVMRDGEVGMYIEDKSPESIASAAEMLYRDAVRRADMGARGRELVLKNFDMRKNGIDIAARLKAYLTPSDR